MLSANYKGLKVQLNKLLKELPLTKSYPVKAPV